MIYAFNASEILQMAVNIEQNGITFYKTAQDKIEDPDVQKIFQYLEQAEIEHKTKFEVLKSMFSSSQPGETVWDPDNELDQYLQMMAGQHIFTNKTVTEKRLAEIGTAEDALAMAIQFEKDSIVFYSILEDAVGEQGARQQVGQLVKEEKNHLRTLALKLRRLKK